MALAVGALHFAALAHCPRAELDALQLSDFYPLSVFRFRWPRPYQLAIASVYLAGFAWLWPRLARAPLAALVAAGLAFAVLSNSLHGARYGLDFPTATWGDGGIEYYHDATRIPGPLWLLRHYNAIQFSLLEHSRTHPPGPVLLYWLLYKLLVHPIAISIAIAALSVGLCLPYLRRLLGGLLPEPVEPGELVLYSVLPALLVYGLAVVDAPIAGLFLGTLCCFVDRARFSWLAAAFLLYGSLCFTFGALFLLPVLVGFELLRRRRLSRSLAVIGGAAALLLLTKLLFGYDWWRGFWTATALENPRGFLLLAQPKLYLWYRLGAIAEVALFFSPFACALWWRGLPRLRQSSPDGFALAWLGPATLLAMLLTGAFKIGEMARIGLFILPYLFLPLVVAYRELDAASRRRTAYSLVGYGVVLQLFGFYQW